MTTDTTSERVAVVTGGASGVGRSICAHLAQRGHRIAVLDRDGEAATTTASELLGAGVQALAFTVDVADRTQVDAATERIRADLGPIQILVTSAAVSGFVPFEEITAEQWATSLAVNLTGTFNCIQSMIGDMVAARWGRIVTISSAAGQTASPRQAHYSASKGGVIALTKTLAAEYASKGITVNTIPPFTVDTPMLRKAHEDGHLPSPDVLARMVPAGKLGTGDDIAAACSYLCSDAAGFVTGQVLAVNGGAYL